MSRLRKLLTAIKATQAAIDLLESEGVDTDKIIRISNAQGRPAGNLKNILDIAAESVELVSKVPPPVMEKKPKLRPVTKSKARPKALPPKRL